MPSGKEMRDDLCKQIDRIRVNLGQPALLKNPDLMVAAWEKLGKIISHQEEERTGIELARAAWYDGEDAAELLGAGRYQYQEYVTEDWAKHPKTAQLLCDPKWQEIGCAVFAGPFGQSCVVLLGRRAENVVATEVRRVPVRQWSVDDPDRELVNPDLMTFKPEWGSDGKFPE